jgi:ribonucleoside-diphosphate reductase alpha chain
MDTYAGELNLTANALKVLEKRYLAKDEEGKAVETPEGLFRRVARAIAAVDVNYGGTPEEAERTEEVFYRMMTSLEFLPNSPTLMNAGRNLGQLSACFVLPVEDSMESIFEAVKNAAIIHKSGGGTGFSFSRLRPSGDVVGSTKGISSGPVSFMTVFDTATEAVKQGGTRRGANMGMLSVEHPDVVKFITCKHNTGKLNNFNISISLTDGFMRAVEQGGDFELKNPRTGGVMQRMKAREVFDLIVENAWKNGEPGVVFMDRINSCNPTPGVGCIESTNPCGEQPLLPYESCNLGSINLSRMVQREEAEGRGIDWERLGATTRRAVHFLDNVIDVNKYPLEEIARMTHDNRKIGLGVMGWADMLIMLGVEYNSAEAVRLAEEVMGFIQKAAREATRALAGKRGVFKNFKGSVYDGGHEVRNATVTTIAPTGTLSIIAGCSSGIEPLFAVSYVRTVMEGTKLVEVNPLFEQIAMERGFWSRELMRRIAEDGSLHGFKEVPSDIKRLFVTAHDITPVEHVSMQAAFQRHVDNAVSKTVNFPGGATAKDVEDVYLLAYRLGCKGVTVYRDGSRDSQVLATGSATGAGADSVEKILPRKRPELIRGTTRRINTGCGYIYVTINEDDDGNVFELFTSMGKSGGCAASQSEAIGRLISLAMRSNVDHQEIVKHLKGVSCHQPSWSSAGRILSCADAIGRSLEQYRMGGGDGSQAPGGKEDSDPGNGKGNGENAAEDVMIIGACPECGGSVQHESGCAVCHDCGFTRCG